MRNKGILAALVVWLAGVTGAVAGDQLAPPAGQVVLEVAGKIAATNEPSKAAFDLAALKKMGATTIETSTPWTEGKMKFEGLSGEALMQALGASGMEIEATAADNYSVVIPMDDFKNGHAMIAYEMNGKPLPKGELGPLWIVYPYDQDPAVNDETHHSRSIWQLKKLTVR